MRFINIDDEGQIRKIMALILCDIKDYFGECYDKQNGAKLSVYLSAIIDDMSIDGKRNFDFIEWNKKKKPTKAKLVHHVGDVHKNRILQLLIDGFFDNLQKELDK